MATLLIERTKASRGPVGTSGTLGRVTTPDTQPPTNAPTTAGRSSLRLGGCLPALPCPNTPAVLPDMFGREDKPPDHLPPALMTVAVRGGTGVRGREAIGGGAGPADCPLRYFWSGGPPALRMRSKRLAAVLGYIGYPPTNDPSFEGCFQVGAHPHMRASTRAGRSSSAWRFNKPKAIRTAPPCEEILGVPARPQATRVRGHPFTRFHGNPSRPKRFSWNPFSCPSLGSRVLG